MEGNTDGQALAEEIEVVEQIDCKFKRRWL